jgi:hypothetical protein
MLTDVTEILALLDVKKILPISRGGSNTVFTDGTYAIKIGMTTAYDVSELQALANTPYGVKLFGYAPIPNVPSYFIKAIKAYGIWEDGHCVKDIPFRLTTRNAYILVTELVKPVLNPRKTYTEHYTQRMYGLCAKIKRKLSKEYDIYWGDPHPWNLGKRDKQYVVIDI